MTSAKYGIPPVRAGRIARPRLIHSLAEALAQGRTLVLVSAPAGFGKTTLVAEWLSAAGLPTAWITLDRNENDPVRFWRTIEGGLQAIPAEPASMDSPGESAASASNPGLFADTASRILVLDDYHHVSAASIHEGMNDLLDHLPRGWAVVILTREDPPLALPRRRAGAQMSEIRTPDLRFTLTEAGSFLNGVYGLDLAAADLAALENRTEGWAVGLQLAAASLQKLPDRHTFIANFSGDDRYVMDYLVEEVFQQQSEEVQTFLLATSILDRLTAPLCDAVSGQHNGQSMLDYLEQANLFLIPLDPNRRRYRYHRLFADLLRRRARQTLSADRLMHAHRQACAWFEREGYPAEAIAQALALPDFDTAAGLLERHALTFFFRSETMLVHRWLAVLPDNLLGSHPLLAALYANTLAHGLSAASQSMAQAATWLERAEAARAREAGAAADPQSGGGRNVVDSFLALSRAYFSLWRGDLPETVCALAQAALETLPPSGESSDINFLRFRSGLNTNLGFCWFARGDYDRATQAFAEAIAVGSACGDFLNTCAAASGEAETLRHKGRLREAAALCRQTLSVCDGELGMGSAPVPYAGVLHLALGRILLEWNQLDAAEAELRRALQLGRMLAERQLLIWATLTLSHVEQARGRDAAALDLLDQIDIRWPCDRLELPAHRTRLWLRQGNLEKASDWARDQIWKGDGSTHTLTLVRVAIARKGSAAPGPEPFVLAESVEYYLDRERELADSAGRVERSIEIGILQALAAQACHKTATALDILKTVMRLARPDAYLRIFLDEGPALRPLLVDLARKDHDGKEYAARILAAMVKEDPRLQGTTSSLLPDPLSAREHEVLSLIGTGAKNSEIASRLFITLNTTKKHITHILQKLEVASRDAAVRRARELGLLA